MARHDGHSVLDAECARLGGKRGGLAAGITASQDELCSRCLRQGRDQTIEALLPADPAEREHDGAARYGGNDVGRQRITGRRRRIVDTMRNGGDGRELPAEACEVAGFDR